MRKNDYYTEFVSNNSTISFVSKTRHFTEKYFGLGLSKIKYSLKNIKNKFVEKFVEKEDSNIREAKVDFDSIAYKINNENEILFNDCVDLAHGVDKAMKNKDNIDFSEEQAKLKELVFSLKESKNEYSKLKEIYEELRYLRTITFKKIIDSKKPKLITADHEIKNDVFNFDPEELEPIIINGVNDSKKEEKVTKEENKVVTPEVKTEEVKTEKVVKPTKPVEIKALIVKTPEKKTNEYSQIKSKISLYDRKISALETKVALNKKSLADAVKYVSKIDKILNEDNLDSREIKMYKELRSERIAMQDEAKAKYDDAKKELENAKIEKALYKQSMIKIDVPQKNGKVFTKEVRVDKYLEQVENDKKLAKVQKEVAKKAKLEAEIAALKAKLAEKETKLNSLETDLNGTSENVHGDYTPEDYHEMIVNMHRPSFY